MGCCRKKDRISATLNILLMRSILPGTIFMLLMASCGSVNEKSSPFSFEQDQNGLALKENGKPVFYYRKTPKTLTGQYICANYIHPLYDLKGDTLTEEFPADHPFHRGVFWAWHQIFIGNRSLGDGWINDSISQEVTGVKYVNNGSSATLNLSVQWKSPNYDSGNPFMNENTSITVQRLSSDMRIIDFEIALTSLVKDLQIGGSADEKGYGGFCVRLRMDDSLKFTSEKGIVTPQNLQITAGPWMDFSAEFGKNSGITGITMLCHPGNPGYPEPWILRQKTSMQNVVFPGTTRFSVPEQKPLILKYRLIIHNGGAEALNLSALQKEYN